MKEIQLQASLTKECLVTKDLLACSVGSRNSRSLCYSNDDCINGKYGSFPSLSVSRRGRDQA